MANFRGALHEVAKAWQGITLYEMKSEIDAEKEQRLMEIREQYAIKAEGRAEGRQLAAEDRADLREGTRHLRDRGETITDQEKAFERQQELARLQAGLRPGETVTLWDEVRKMNVTYTVMPDGTKRELGPAKHPDTTGFSDPQKLETSALRKELSGVEKEIDTLRAGPTPKEKEELLEKFASKERVNELLAERKKSDAQRLAALVAKRTILTHKLYKASGGTIGSDPFTEDAARGWIEKNAPRIGDAAKTAAAWNAPFGSYLQVTEDMVRPYIKSPEASAPPPLSETPPAAGGLLLDDQLDQEEGTRMASVLEAQKYPRRPSTGGTNIFEAVSTGVGSYMDEVGKPGRPSGRFPGRPTR